MYILFFRTIITYLLLICAIRLMGKRQIGELEINEFVITMILSELAAIPISDNTIPITFALLPIIVLISLEVIVSFISIKNRSLKKFIGGTPSILINKGKLCRNEMERVRIGLDELLGQLRSKGISDVFDVEYAILEENGQISVIQKSSARPLTPSDISLNVEEKGIVHTVVADGQISDFNLSLLGHDRKWLKKLLKKKKCALDQVFLLTVDDVGNVNLIKKGDIL